MQLCEFSVLEGSVIQEIRKIDDETLLFITDKGTFVQLHQQDCCESVSIEDITGDLRDIQGAYVGLAEEAVSHEEDDSGYESCTWTFYNLSTTKGDLAIRWFGSSNGYYSETASFYRLTPEEAERYLR